jgi:pyruvate/2-oxoglutarate/acetoin dehydrogenase E1 component
MTAGGSRISYEEAITEALRLEMYRDSSVVLFSSGGSAPELARLFGPERVVEGITPAAPVVLAAAGAAGEGQRPVCEVSATGPGPLDHIAELGALHASNGRARLVREGERLTLVAHGAAVALAQRAAEQIELDADVLDLRSLQPLDRNGVLTSVRKTGKLVIVEPSPSAARVTAELVAQIWQEAFEYLDAPPRRIRVGESLTETGSDRDVETIMEACLELLGY